MSNAEDTESPWQSIVGIVGGLLIWAWLFMLAAGASGIAAPFVACLVPAAAVVLNITTLNVLYKRGKP